MYAVSGLKTPDCTPRLSADGGVCGPLLGGELEMGKRGAVFDGWLATLGSDPWFLLVVE